MLSWQEAQSFDRLAELYDRLGELSNDAVGDWLPSVLPPRRSRALDLGCGAGRHAVLLADWFEQISSTGEAPRHGRSSGSRPATGSTTAPATGT
jgi:ubiquinone/menaquinone biosynthesis C-methylase UbiE